ncbi:homing endonuclease associated repeat-containing protein [Geobacter sp.]|uniref:homing endonuclease associated repeat-containing protein n=1 Tax=Geobacter sp. TaxID=46610 RepID=UPI0027B97A2F|nr:HNH endonuclease [Geobacter sp.]
MQFELKRLPDYTDETLISEIRRVAELVKHPTISRTEFQKHSRVHTSTLEKRFGCWESAMNAAGLSDRFDSSNKAISKEDIITELQKVSSRLGVKTFSREQFNANAPFKDSVIRRVFGTWRKAMEAAGLTANKLGQRYTDEECFENLLQVWTHYGRQPQHREMKSPPSIVGPKAYTLRWETWTKALYAFVTKVNEDLQTVDVSSEPVSQPSTKSSSSLKSKTDERDNRDIRLGLRYTVLNRDRFKCVLCGNSPAISLDCRLHVDHIHPFSKDGKTEIENLRTLCQHCNLGKSNRIEVSDQPALRP